MGEICLIRHGQASFGSDDYDRLSELGRRQSATLAESFMSVGYQPTHIISGPLERHKATASIMTDVYGSSGIDLPEIEIMEEFREYDAKGIIMVAVRSDPALAELLPKIYGDPGAFRKLFDESMSAWISGALNFGDIETFDDLKGRVSCAMERISRNYPTGSKVAVFTSGGAIMASIADNLGISASRAMRLNWQIVNTSVTRYVFDREKISLAEFNSTAHLRMSCDTSLLTWY